MAFYHGPYPSQFNATPVHPCEMHSSGQSYSSLPNDASSSHRSSPLMGSGYPLEVHRTTTRRYTTPDGRHVEETVSVVERVSTPESMSGHWNADRIQPHAQNGWPYDTPEAVHEHEYQAPAPAEPMSEHSSHSSRQSLSPDALLLQPYIPQPPPGHFPRDSSESAPADVAPEFSAWSPQLSGTSGSLSGSSHQPPIYGGSWSSPAVGGNAAMDGETPTGSFLGVAKGHDPRSDIPTIAISQEQYAYTEGPAQYGWADQNTAEFAQQQLVWDSDAATTSRGDWHSSSSSPSSAVAESGCQYYPEPTPFSDFWDPHATGANQGPMNYTSYTPDAPVAPQFHQQYPTQSVGGSHANYPSHALPTAEATNWSSGTHSAVATVGLEAETVDDDDECGEGDEGDEYSGDECDSDGGYEAPNVSGAPEQYTNDSSQNTISDCPTWSVEKSASSRGEPLPPTSATLMAACEHGVPRGVYCPDCRLYYELFGSYMSPS